jgi:hypothetical protein
MYRTLATMAAGRPPASSNGADIAAREDYLPKLQVAVAREDGRAGQGLVLAAKGGHNGERHNHNDVGNVIVYLDGNPVIVDVGMKQYSKETFTDRRYEIWAMQSGYHNVPLVNGCMQAAGAHAAGRDARFATGADETSFGVEIASAYPPDAGLLRWRRECVLERSAHAIRIRDEFRFRRKENGYEQRFLTACRPREAAGTIVLEVDATRSVVLEVSPPPTRVALHELAVEDNHVRLAWEGKTLYQVRLGFDAVGAKGGCEIRIAARPEAGQVASPSLEIERLP